MDTGPFFYDGHNIKQLMRDAVRHNLIPHPKDLILNPNQHQFGRILESVAGFLIKKRVPMTDILESPTVMQYLKVAKENSIGDSK